MASLNQKLVPGIVGISTYVDGVYHMELQRAALATCGGTGPINRLRVVTVTLDFDALLGHVRAGRLEAAEEQVADTVRALEAGGADFVVVTSGTTSTLTARARGQTSIPFLDLAQAAADEAAAVGATSVGLLSTRHAVAGGIFQAAAERGRASLLTPSPATAERVDTTIFDELVCGVVSEAGMATLREAVDELARRGAGAIILGNTDMTLAADRLEDVAPVPIVDSARAHARAATRAALEGRL